MANSFDGDTKRITIDSANPNVVVKDLYSEWKEWALQGNNLGYAQAFRTFGGDPTVAGQTAPAYYFLTNGWRIIVDGAGIEYSFSYNLYTDEGENPVITANGATALLNNSDVGIVKTDLDQALDYNGIVWVDFTDGTSGTEYPLGTLADPVNNFVDAVAISESYGFKEIHIVKGTGTADAYMADYKIVGTNPQACVVTLEADINIPEQTARYRNTVFRNVTLTGVACGCGMIARDSFLHDVAQIGGEFLNCGLSGTITPSTRINPSTGIVFSTTFDKCYSRVPGTGSPIFDMTVGTYADTAFRAYSGGLRVLNADNPLDTATFEYIAGKITIESSCTDGYLSVRGVVLVNDLSTGSTVDTTASVSALAVNTGDVSVSVDEAAIALATRQEMDANSTQLAQLITNTTNIATDAPTAAEIRAEIDSNSTQLSSIKTTVEAIPTNTYNIPNYSTELADIQSAVDSIPTATYDVPTAVEIRQEIDLNSTGHDTILSAISGINDYDVELTNIQSSINNISIPDYSTELANIQTAVDGIDDTNYTVTLANIQSAVDAIPTVDHSLQLDAIEADVAQIPTLNYTTTLLNIKNAVDNIPTVTYTIPDYSTELGSIQTAVDSKPSIGAITTVVDNAVATVTPTDVPTAAEIRSEIDANSTKLQQISNDVNDIVTPTATQIRQEIDSNSSRLQSIKDTVESIPTTTYGTALSNIQSSVDGITVPTPPDYSTELTNIQNAVDGISVPNYSAELSNIQTAVDGITVPDYSVELGNIQTTVDGIPTTDYSATLSSIQSTVGSIPTTNYTTTLGTIQSLVSAIPTADHTSALSDIQTSVDAIPTVDNSTAIANVQSAVDAIPTETYTATLATLQGSVDAIPTATYTVPSLAEITTAVDTTVNDNVDPKLAEINEGVKKSSLKIPHNTTF